MEAVQALLTQMADLLAADTTTLDAALDVEVVLAKAPFTPGPTLAIGDLTLADFDGYAAKAKDAGSPNVYQDPATGDSIIDIPAPAGGWEWETTGVTNLPQTIYGFGLTDSTGATLYGSELLDAPVQLTASGQGISIPGGVKFRIPQGALS